MLYTYPPRAIRVLLDDRRKPISEVQRIMEGCCEIHDPKDRGWCGYTGLCRKLFDARDTTWEWDRSLPIKDKTRANAKNSTGVRSGRPSKDAGAWLQATLHL